MLHSAGKTEYLLLSKKKKNKPGEYEWTTDKAKARDNAEKFFANSEGIDVSGNKLYFTSKMEKSLFILDLDAMTYEVETTESGLFDGQPDQVKRLIDEDGNSMLYFCEEAGSRNGVHARNENGWYFTIFESTEGIGETTGLAFSPNGKYM